MSTQCNAIGIDLGTSYTAVGIYQNDRAEVIANEQGNRTTPCCISFSGTEQLVGDPAITQLVKNASNTVYDVKKIIGRKFADVKDDLGKFTYTVEEGKNGAPVIKCQAGEEAKELTAPQVSGAVLKFMKETAEAFLGNKVKKAVISVPAHFNDEQRAATREAASYAGLDILRIINEPTAAAIAYGMDSNAPGTPAKLVCVYDMGGSNLDCTLIRADNGMLEILATSSAPLGGDLFDDKLVEHFVKEFKRKNKEDISGNKKSMRRLRSVVEKAKRVLSASAQTAVEVDSLFDGIDFFTNITRGRFEEMIGSILKECIPVLDKVLAEANLPKGAVTDVVMAGGCSRIPKVQALVSTYFDGKEVKATIMPDEVVAVGATLQAFLLSTNRSNYTDAVSTHSVTPLSIGVELGEGEMFTIIPRNTAVPFRSAPQMMSTSVDNQTAVYLQVYEGERVLAANNTLLGTLSLEGIPPAKAGEAKIEVVFAVDETGALSVEALESTSGVKASLAIESKKDKLSMDEIRKIVSEGVVDRIPEPEPEPEEEEAVDSDMD